MKKFLATLALFGLAVGQSADAAVITTTRLPARATTAAEQTGGAPVGFVHTFKVTTDADILSLFQTNLVPLAGSSGSFYKHPSGSTTGAPDPNFVALIPALGVTSFFDTPGDTGALGVAFPGDGTNNSSFGDTQDNGPQTDFTFAQITVPTGFHGLFSGRIAIAGGFDQAFSFVIPEPATFGMASMALVGLAVLRRRK